MGEFGISDIDILDPDSHPQRDRHVFPADDIHPRFPMVPPLFTGGCYQPTITRPSTRGQILGEGRRAWPRLDGLLGLGGFRVPEAEAVARLFCTCCAMERLRGCASRCHWLEAQKLIKLI